MARGDSNMGRWRHEKRERVKGATLSWGDDPGESVRVRRRCGERLRSALRNAASAAESEGEAVAMVGQRQDSNERHGEGAIDDADGASGDGAEKESANGSTEDSNDGSK